ncbi:hypothetical protein R69776_00863 [Paraburkholderia nemoris]|uniref:Tetratricopeptide repeat protein n=2 Tax=Paraburkholderia nemoris TaxID=2793076 RepID=A0ABM8QMY6_9BURK|nr:hypothetical protein R69776_00863 [Paraburkholderia nemoris]
MRMDRESHDFPSEDLPYTMEKLKRRGIVARLYFGAGLRKLEDDYLNPKRGDVLASQRRYRRYLAGDKRIVKEASLAVWSPMILAALIPTLAVVILAGTLGWQIVSPYITGASQTISTLIGSHRASADVSTATPAANSESSATDTTKPAIAADQGGSPASDAAAPAQQLYIQAPSAASTTEASNPANDNSQDTEVGQDLSMKLQALLAQAEQQFDAGQYRDAAATTEAILEIEPSNVSAQRMHAASLRNLATVTAADAAEAQGGAPSPPGQVAQATPFPAPVPYNPPIAAPCVAGCYRNSRDVRHLGGR